MREDKLKIKMVGKGETIMDNAKEITKSSARDYSVYTSFRGRLSRVDDIQGRHEFRIEDPVYGVITCIFKEELIDQVKTGVFERVEITGRALFTPEGVPKYIRADGITSLRNRSDLPQFSDIERLSVKNVEGLLRGYGSHR